ncbi:nucleotide exchange factor SIL1-like [Limulus polyphemus]|uniref:Nucleotide exchange factor SIL1 n=1 Tax=Limulus polyphemus TaxID=6850 RepID=A0ABM1BIS4_LIMPO|nr:nucleotide exchange factor SIL1-like [Limulus polyphemus]XP_013782820.1 nucleotide exchange factor SIL1-like [Limulus polyphemus]
MKCERDVKFFHLWMVLGIIITFNVKNILGIDDTSKSNKAVVLIDTKQESYDTDNEVKIEEESSAEPFIPTKDWQKIKPGQAIPPGLHVRMNLQTGLKEAKLLDKEMDKDSIESNPLIIADEETKSWDVGSDQKRGFSHKELKEALKSFKAEEYHQDSGQNAETIRAKFRSIEDLKEEFAALNINIKSDTEILIELLGRYKKADNTEKLDILQDLEYLVHQYDVAQDFIKLGGLQLVSPDLNITDEKVRELVAFTIGSAMQGNPKVQISVLQSNIMQNLLRLIVLDPSPNVKARSFYAISCLVRHFPLAQQWLVENGGLSAFSDVFNHGDPQHQKLQLKVVTLLYDLVTEQKLTEKHAKKDAVKEKLRQYKKFHLQEALVEQGFCLHIPKLLLSPDYDTQEKVIRAMLVMVDLCKESFQSSLGKLKDLELWYKSVAQNEGETDTRTRPESLEESEQYFTLLYEFVHDLINLVEQKSKDEL